MSININELLQNARVIQNRLVDSDFHDTESAVPEVATQAANIIGSLLDLISKSVLSDDFVKKLAENIAISEYLCDPPDDTTFESLGTSLNLDDSFSDDIAIWEPFERYGHETVLGYMEDLALSIENQVNQAVLQNIASIQSKTRVNYWDSYSDKSISSDDNPFLMEITDHRLSSGQMYVDIGPASGDIDDIMSFTLEINRLPGDTTDRQCAHLHFDGSNLAVSIFKDGSGYILQPENGVCIRDIQLANKELAWRIQDI